MELTERETLVKVEQKLNNVIENQNKISKDMLEIFRRIESESKIISGVKGELQAHLETTSVQKENCTEKFKYNTQEIQRTSDKIKNVKEDYEKSDVDIKKSIKSIREDLEKFIREEFTPFRDRIDVSFKNFRLFVIIIYGILMIISPFLTIVLKEYISK